MSAEVTWRLSDKGEQCIFSVATGVSVRLKELVSDCKRELGEAIQSLAGKKIDFYRCDGKSVAFVTIKLEETPTGFIGRTTVSTQDCHKESLSYVRSIFYLLNGWADYYSVSTEGGEVLGEPL